MKSPICLSLAVAILVSLLTNTSLLADDYSDSVLADNPLAYWRLGDTGPTAVDLTGNGNTGTASGAGVLFGQASLVPTSTADNSVRVPGGAGVDRIVVPGFNKFPGGSTGYTVEYFLTADSLPTPTGYLNIVGDGESGGDFYLMNYLTSAGRIRPHFNNGSGAISVDSDVLTTGRTYHVATTWDQTSGTGSVYIDGALSATIAAGSALPLNDSNPIFIGRDGREAGTGSVLNIDEAAIYNNALSSAQIQSHLVAAGFNAGVTKEFRTDGFGTFTTIPEPSSTDYADVNSGNGVTFTLVSGTLNGVGAPDTLDLNDGIAIAAPANADTFLPSDGAANQVRVLIDLNQAPTKSLLISDISTFGTTTTDGERAYQDYTLYGSNDLIAPSTVGDPEAAGWSLVSDVIAFADDLTSLTQAEHGVNIAVDQPFRYLLWVVDNHATAANRSAHYVEFDINGVPTPEPTSIMIWSLLGIAGVYFACRNRKRK